MRRPAAAASDSIRLALERKAPSLPTRQSPLEGGFAGRTNKLVDGCYSFWQGAIVPLVAEACLLPPASQVPGPGDAQPSAGLPPPSPAEAQAKTWVDELARQLEAAERKETEVRGAGLERRGPRIAVLAGERKRANAVLTPSPPPAEPQAEEAYEKVVETGKSADPSSAHSVPTLQRRARDAGRKAQRLREVCCDGEAGGLRAQPNGLVVSPLKT